MAETVTMHGQKLELDGKRPKVGDQAPDFRVVDKDLKDVVFSQLPQGGVYVLSAVPSLDTPVCNMETRRFSKEAEKLGKGVEIITVSMDLPFAQARWCGAAGVENIHVYSDHRDASFGKAYGVLIKQLRLLSRTIFIVDKQRRISYIEDANEITNEPNYDRVLEALAKLRT